MMTSFAFILGVVPLVISDGAGAEMRRTLGTAVFSGMLGVTLFGIFLTPGLLLRDPVASPTAAPPTPGLTESGGVGHDGHSHGAGGQKEVAELPETYAPPV